MSKQGNSAALLAQCKEELSECEKKFQAMGTKNGQTLALIARRLSHKKMDRAWIELLRIGRKPTEFVLMARDADRATGIELLRPHAKAEKEKIEKVRDALHRLRAATTLALKDGVLPRNSGRLVEITREGRRSVVASFGWGDMDEHTHRSFYPLELISMIELYEEMLDDHEKRLPARRGQRIGGNKKSAYPPKIGMFIRHMAEQLGGTYPATLAAVANTLFYWNKVEPPISKETALSMARSGGGIAAKREKDSR